jgi:spermidine synthase
MSSASKKSTPAPDRQGLVLTAVGALGVSCVMTQLALMRELLGAFAGNEMVLGVVLGLWLLLMGIGAWLGHSSDKLRNQLTALALIQMLVAFLPLAQVFLLRALRNVVFIRGAAVGVTETVGAAFVLLLPYCLIAGYALTLACAILAREQGPAGIGRAYVADSIGSIIGGASFSLVLVRSFDHIAILVCPALLNLLLAGLVGLRVQGSKFAARLLPASALLLGIGLIATTLLSDLDGVSTRLQYPRQHVVARANSPYGKLIVTESDGQFDFLENGIPITSTRDDQHVEETVHYAMAQRPEARRVLLVSGGVSGTAREILKYDVPAVDYVELDPLILALGQRYVPGNLADGRIRVINTDGRLFVKQTPEKYEVAIIDVPAPATAQLNRFYTMEFLAEVKRVLARDGVVGFALGQYENYVSPELARMLSSAFLAAKHSYRNVLVIPGGRVFFLASDGPLYPDIAARVEGRHIKTRLVNRHYLDGMLTADRMADLANATTQPAAMNKDFSPVLYYYHLRHWTSQFNVQFGVIQVGLVVLLGYYLVRLRGSAFVLFASGFAASALEVVLLLAFQVLCGSVYHQVGVIVTVFMTGLAVGASMMNRSFGNAGSDRSAPHIFWFGGSGNGKGHRFPLTPALSPGERENSGQFPGEIGASGTVERGSATPPLLKGEGRGEGKGDDGSRERRESPNKLATFGRGTLSVLALAIAGYAVVLPLLLPLLNQMGGSVASLVLVKVIIAALTLVMAVLVGMQFPLANRLEFDGTVAWASRLYTADFVGAFLGALLACTLLIPLIGVVGVCLLTAALNILGALAGRRRTAAA